MNEQCHTDVFVRLNDRDWFQGPTGLPPCRIGGGLISTRQLYESGLDATLDSRPQVSQGTSSTRPNDCRLSM
jgi:hypothetical protein